MSIIKPRGWQIIALNKFKLVTTQKKAFILDGTPGIGKTFFAAFASKFLFDQGLIDFVLIVVPTTVIKGDADEGFLGDWNKAGIQITTTLKDGHDAPTQFRGAVITYQQLGNMMGTIDAWVRNGLRLFVVFDEIHHSSDNQWGAVTEQLGALARHILGMSGTCFRGDQCRISFVPYDASGKAIADHRYSYREAVRDRVCRPVEFRTDDSLAQFMLDNENHAVRVSEAVSDDELRGATRTVFRADHDFLQRLIERADDELDQYRSWDRDAGGLIVCRAGFDDTDNRHLHYVADLVQRTLGERPEVISYDDRDANAKIERFRRSDQRWLCAVRKITEGCSIKRLRVEVMACRPTTELLFRQLVGRVVRVDDEKKPGTATVFIAKFTQLSSWASRIAADAESGVKERDEARTRTAGEAGQTRVFTSLGASHEAAGAISDFGDQYSADEVNAAERLRSSDAQLQDIPVTTLAYLQRKFGVVPEPMTAPEPPLQVRKAELRLQIVKKARHLAITRNPNNADFKRVWIEIGETFGPKSADALTDHYSIEVMRQILSWLMATLAKEVAPA
jgi:superfamily II DNA or RNA helicase